MSFEIRKASFVGIVLIALVGGVVLGYFAENTFLALPKSGSQTPTMILSAYSVSAGTEYSITFSGFPANIDIIGWVVNENPPSTFEVGTTDANGELSVSSYAPETPGEWLLCASDKDYEFWVQAVLTVT